MEWKAWLRGDSIDLRTLLQIFSHDDPRVFVNAEGQYLLESSAFDGLSEGAELQAAAERLLSLVNGAAKVFDDSHRPVQLVGHYENKDGSLHAIVGMETIRVRSHVFGGLHGGQAGPPAATTWIALAESDPAVTEALDLLGTIGLDWIALYKLYEIVTEDVNERAIVHRGWASGAKLSAFRVSANHPDVSGKDARHARMAGDPPNRSMALEEARQFIRGLVRYWLQWKAESAPSADK